VRTLAVEADVPIRTVVSGAQMSAGDIAWRVLWPPADIDPATSDDTAAEGSPVNDASVVIAVEVHGLRVLLTGDIEPSAQEALLRAGTDLAADVLKVPHHGSARQSAEFLEAVGARLAVVTVGADNDYGHPAPSLLDGLDDSGTVVARTDDDGDVAVLAPRSHGAPLTWVPRGPSGGAD
jgi:competence protein ComEC